MDILKNKINLPKPLLSLVVNIFLGFVLVSCLDNRTDNGEQANNENVGETVYITLTSAESSKTGRYLGTYADVDGVLLRYRRSDGIGDNSSVELQLMDSNYGSATTTMQWTGAIENVIPGARYDFEAMAYTDGMQCYQFVEDLTAENTTQNNPAYDPDFVGCNNFRQAEPIIDRSSNSGDYWSGTYNGVRETFKAYLFNGSRSYHKLTTGNNNLQLRMSPVLKESAVGTMIPYISKIDRNPTNYAANDNITLSIEFKGPQGNIVGLTGKAVGTCNIEEENAGNCSSINETFLQNPNTWESDPDLIIKLCPSAGIDDNWWENQCVFDESTIITGIRQLSYQIPKNPPDEIRFEFVLNMKNTIASSKDSIFTYADGNLGLSNTIWFSMVRNSIEQISELIFMPTVQDISVYYDMSSNTGDLSYALMTQGVTDDIEIFANLEYLGSTPLGFPSPYLRLVNTGSESVQTLYGRMDKNEIYEANLKLNFVHTPSGFEYTSEYPLPANNKPKFGEMATNWKTFKQTGQCEHCMLTGDPTPADTWGVDYGLEGFPDDPYFDENTTDEDPWTLNEPKLNGASLAYSNLQGREQVSTSSSYARIAGHENTPTYDPGISYMELKNTNFLGTNLSDFNFNYVNLEGSQFINSQINNTCFKRSKLDGVIFTSDDGLETTQNLPYTDLRFETTSGDNMELIEITAKISAEDTQFRNVKMNNNLIYQSDFDGFTITGEFRQNDVVETTIENSVLENLNLQNTSFVSTSLALSSLKGSDLSKTWFDSASGTDFYLVECDEETTLPTYGNINCRNNYLEFAEGANQEFVLDLPNDKNRASYLYNGDADSFKLLVQNPASVAVEVSSKSGDIQFALRKSGSSEIIAYTSGDSRITSRTDGNYTTVWKYFSDFPPLADDEYYYVQVFGTTGVFYIISYYQEL